MADHHLPPSLKDWALLAIGVVFSVAGVFILSSDRDVGIVTLAIFGTCTAVFAMQIWGKLRARNFTASQVEVAGGVPIRPKRTLGLILGGWMLALGIVLVVFGATYGAPFRWLSGIIAVVGAVLLIATALGRFPGGYLQFDPDALTIAQAKWRVAIPWDEISGVTESEFSGNPMLLIVVTDAASLIIDPPEAAAAVYKAIAKNQSMIGAEFAVMTTHYGIDLPILAAAVTHYARNRKARASLRQRSLRAV